MSEDKILGVVFGVIITVLITAILVGLFSPVTIGANKFKATCESRGYDIVVVDKYSNVMCINYVDTDIILIKYNNGFKDN